MNDADIQFEPAEEPGRYTFTAAFDGLDEWPAPVSLYLHGIDFGAHQTLERRIPWAKYRDLDRSEHLMAPKDQVTVRFYDSEIVSLYASRTGIGFEKKNPKGNPPYVEANLSGGGRIEPGRPGFEVVNNAGEVVCDLGGSDGVIFNARTEIRYGASISLNEKYLPEGFLQTDELLVRYVNPEGVMVIDETWQLTDGK